MMNDHKRKNKEIRKKKCYLKGIVGRYSLLDELGYRAKLFFIVEKQYQELDIYLWNDGQHGERISQKIQGNQKKKVISKE